MGRYIVKRVFHSLFVVIGVSIIVFALSHLSGDPAALMLPPTATADDIARFRAAMGFDRPLVIQYLDFARGALTGNFGKSFMQGENALTLVLQRVPASLKLTLTSLFVSLAIALLLGVVTAVKRGSWIDQLGRIMALIGQTLPNFYLGIILILFVSVRWAWLPPTGGTHLKGLILPGITLGLFTAAETTRLLRSSLLEVLNQDYVKTARGKGLPQLTVIMKHAVRNAAVPVVTIIGLQLGTLMGRAMVTETVFAYPGMGMLALNAIANRDFLVLQAFVIVMSVLVTSFNLVADVVCAYLDPRIRTIHEAEKA